MKTRLERAAREFSDREMANEESEWWNTASDAAMRWGFIAGAKWMREECVRRFELLPKTASTIAKIGDEEEQEK